MPDCKKQAIVQGHCKKHFDIVNNPTVSTICSPCGVVIPPRPVETRKENVTAANATKGRHKRGLSIFSEMKAVNTIINNKDFF